MHITIINPNNVTQKGDFFGTGIPYLPIIPAYLAAYLLSKGCGVKVIDAFGQDPSQKKQIKEFIICGISLPEIAQQIPLDTDYICIFAGHVVEHNIIISIIYAAKQRFPDKNVIVFENSQAVTAYSLKIACREFFKYGCDYVVYGNPEEAIFNLAQGKRLKKISGLIYRNGKKLVINPASELNNLDKLPFPAWRLFPLENYWKLGYAHAPYAVKYLPLLTSRGCPYQCNFCIIPFTNQRKWLARSAENVIAEMRQYASEYGVTEFHIEDLNPTLDKCRIQRLCDLIIASKMKITLKFASGVKLETLDEYILRRLYAAGCRYISFSPESGSAHVLNLMNKPFDYLHGLKMTRFISKLGITSQACFVLGYPGETLQDLALTKDYALALAKAGIDEIAFFIMTPIPGSKPYELSQIKSVGLSHFTFSPEWKQGYSALHSFRKKLYFSYFCMKLRYHPLKLLKQPFNYLFKRFETKMEMTPYRVLKTWYA